ncbi:hypothetical protein [Thalassococcus halodurans]|nr:hypothetical protein [Thalassococcus halodurans]
MTESTLIPAGFGAVMLTLIALALVTAHSDQTIGTGTATQAAPIT